MRIEEPLNYFYKRYKFQYNIIDSIIIGKKYIAVILKNGNIGITANLFEIDQIYLNRKITFDINNFEHRVFLNAYYNALLNYENKDCKPINLFDFVDFSIYKNLVLIGYSEPLMAHISKINQNFHIFDNQIIADEITDQSLQKTILNTCDLVILTATSIFNNTFLEIMEESDKDCDIFLVGPSSILSPEMLRYPKIKGIFGTVFLNNDERVLEIITNGEGTSFFKKYGKKIALIRNGSL